uniref:DM2 domain-containing protein n=1 Tax=viral metagenome TaxID=1070528 RepID=A0A6C0DKT9_9ZZZZ
MVRTVKSAEKSQTTPAPVVESKTAVAAASKPRAKKPKAEAAPVATAAPVVDAAASAAAPVVATTDVSLVSSKMTEFGAKLQQLVSVFNTIKNDFKTLEKSVNKEVKIAQKASSKKRRNNVNRKPSGFVKPTPISNELAEFLGKTIGTEMARTDVSKEINAYITANGLQDKKNGRQINADEKLSKLLRLTNEDVLTYFNLQRYMKHHFIKADVVATA